MQQVVLKEQKEREGHDCNISQQEKEEVDGALYFWRNHVASSVQPAAV